MRDRCRTHTPAIFALGLCLILIACKARSPDSSGLMSTASPSNEANDNCPLNATKLVFTTNPPAQQTKANRRLSILRDEAKKIAASFTATDTKFHDWREFTAKRYGARGLPIHACLSQLGKDFEALLVDPAVAFHHSAFFTAIAKMKAIPKDPWALRVAVAASIGYEEFYRGMALNAQALASVKEQGMLANHMRKNNNQVDPRLFDDDAISQLQLRLQASLNLSKDVFISLTKHREVAESVSTGFLQADAKVYIFTVRVPTMDTLFLGAKDDLFPYPDDWLMSINAGVEFELTFKDGTRRRYKADHNIEAMVFLQIDPEEITAIEPLATSRITAAGWELPH